MGGVTEVRTGNGQRIVGRTRGYSGTGRPDLLKWALGFEIEESQLS